MAVYGTGLRAPNPYVHIHACANTFIIVRALVEMQWTVLIAGTLATYILLFQTELHILVFPLHINNIFPRYII